MHGSGGANSHETSRIAGKVSAPHNCNTQETWQPSHKQREPLAAEDGIAVAYAGEVSAWTCWALDDAEPDRIADKGENDRSRHTGLLECKNGGVCQGDDDLRGLRSKFGDERIETGRITFPAEQLDHRGPAVLVSERAERRKQQMYRCAVTVADGERAEARVV